MLPKTIGNYGGPFSDAFPIENPETDMDAAKANRLYEDSAQMTNTSTKACIVFDTVASGSATVSGIRSQWGNGDAQKPTVERTNTGLYTVTFPASFDDGLDLPDSVETVSFFDADAKARSADPADDVLAQVLTVAGNVITLKVESAFGTLADVGNNSSDPITVSLRCY
jgi:hypothetical protein